MGRVFPIDLRVQTATLAELEARAKIRFTTDWSKEDHDRRAAELNEVYLNDLIFVHCLTKKEMAAADPTIDGEERLWRVKQQQDYVRHGLGLFAGLWLNYVAWKETQDGVPLLERIYQALGARNIYLFGDILERPNSNHSLEGEPEKFRSALCFGRLPRGGWNWFHHDLHHTYGVESMVAISRAK